MADSVGLPVFAYVDDKLQAAQLRDYFISLGGDMKPEEDGREESDEWMTEKVQELAGHCSVVGGKLDNENEVEMTLNSLVSLIVPLPSDRVVSVVRTFCEKLSGKEFEGSKSRAAVRVLSNLFHGFGAQENAQHSLQYDIYCCMLRIGAENSGIVAELPTDVEKLREWFDEWKLDTDKTRNCLRLLHKAFRGQQSAASSKVMIELLTTYTKSDADKALPDARECVRSAIGDPGTFLFDHLLTLLPVQSLEKGDPKVYRILNIFVSGSLQDYMKFYESEKDFVTKELGLDQDVLVNKMRILTLMSVGEVKEEVSFAELAEILNLDRGEELEDFVIKAVQSKAIIAKLDQVKQRLLIGGVKNRRFERPQWEQLGNRLDAWAANLRQAKRHVDQVLAG